MQDFRQYVKQQHIVFAFVRFHPIVGNGVDFKAAYNRIYERKTVGTNLTYEDVIATKFSKHKHKDIRHILKIRPCIMRLMKILIPLEDLVDIYYSTMDRDKADEYYYFGKNTDFDFYIAKKVWNQNVYQRLCDIAGADVNSEFFPAYRTKRS